MALHILGAGAAIFVLGAASATVMKAAAPYIGRALRPVVRTAVREGMLIQRQVQAIAQEARQDIRDITAEARGELDRQAKGDEQNS
jgi:ABC-type protease/lipase transport system fused ATPase/permease subunit